jgi:FAD/FMN-containing dehydrogenase
MAIGEVESSELDVEELEKLKERIRGPVLTPGDEGFEDARRIWNGMIERHPAAVVRCSGNADVIAALALARENGLPVSVRGGGHNVAGNALCDGGVVIDLSAMNGVRMDLERRTVRVGGGAVLADVDHETQAFGLATPLGAVPRTGVAGLTLHGGLGFLTRRFGLSCDNLVAADVVTADGRLLQVDDSNHPDLLWALRGGGGNFGVVTSLEFRLHEVGPEVFFVMTIYPADVTGEALRTFHEVMSEAPEELMVLGILWTAGHEEPIPEEWHGKPVFVIVGGWSGPLEDAERVTKPLREIATPIVDVSGPMPYEVVQQVFDPEYPDGRRYYWKSIYVGDLDDTLIGILARGAARRPSPLSSIDVWPLGGALRREPEGGSAFARRSDPYLIGIEANWDDPAEDDANIAWARELVAELEEVSPGGTYLNFGGFAEEGEALLAETYGEHYARLRELKATYDPDNVFRSTFNIAVGAR